MPKEKLSILGTVGVPANEGFPGPEGFSGPEDGVCGPQSLVSTGEASCPFRILRLI
jgi:hypothetical protein